MIHFSKMQAYGNDYVFIEILTQNIKNPSALARFVSNRHCGIGSDGMILICPSELADFKMRVFNPDGSEAEMCGNALRSVAKFVFEKGFTKKIDFSIETIGGIKNLHLDIKNNKVDFITASLGAPTLEHEKVPVLVQNTNGRCIEYPIEVYDRTFFITAVSMGNPHCVTFIDDVLRLDLEKFGSAIEHHPYFPQKVNVEFAQVVDHRTALLRTWERNCGETLSCGTGCCVVAVGGFLTGRLSSEVTIRQLGGEIEIKWDTSKNNILMIGKSEFVFDGEIDENILEDKV